MKNISWKSKLLFFVSLIAFCHCNNSENNREKTSQEKIKIRFFYRTPIGTNNSYSYTDNLVIENYENNQYLIRDVIQIATNYFDTAKADLPICAIRFYGEGKNENIGKGLAKLYHVHVNNSLLSIYSNKCANSADSNETLMVISVGFWKDGKFTHYRSDIDSLSSSKLLINNKE